MAKSMKTNLKVTYEDVYQEFRRRHPNLSKRIRAYSPYGYATIRMYDPLMRRYILYNYDDSRAYYTD